MSTQSAQPRQPRGVPVGGEWAERRLAASGLSLADLPVDTDALERRRAAFEREGFVPGMSTLAVTSPETTNKIDNWWSTQFLQAEYGSEDGGDGYRQMPDDYTPGQSGGRSLAGRRRTHRMKYTAGGVTVRMPSRTAINRFSNETGNETFDVPVAASLPDGDVQGWVRVTKAGPNRWLTTGVGFPTHTEVGVAEAVGASLEGRSVAGRMQEYGDLIERRRQRLADQGADLENVNSTWIESVGYDKGSGVMATMTTSGRMYGHKVPENTYLQMSASRSPGSTFNKLIKGEERAQVTRCDDCGRFFAQGSAHTCPDTHKEAVGDDSGHTDRARAAAAELTSTAAVERRKRNMGTKQAVNIDVAKTLDDYNPAHATPGASGLYGKRGWTKKAAGDNLGKFTSALHVPSAYMSLSDGTRMENGDIGLIRYSGVDAEAAGNLLKTMPKKALEDRQNDGPTARTVLESVRKNPGVVEAHGYVAGPDRADERITTEGVFIYDDELTNERDVLLAARDKYEITDATRRPDDCILMDSPHRPGEKAWFLWWD